MANESFWGELRNNLPGATADGLKAFFREFASIQDDFVNGRITDLRVSQAGAHAQTLHRTRLVSEGSPDIRSLGQIGR